MTKEDLKRARAAWVAYLAAQEGLPRPAPVRQKIDAPGARPNKLVLMGVSSSEHRQRSSFIARLGA